MSSQIIRSKAKETNAGVALTTRRFILNISVIQTKFICIVDATSVDTLSIIFMKVNVTVSGYSPELLLACILSHTEFCQTILSPVYDF